MKTSRITDDMFGRTLSFSTTSPSNALDLSTFTITNNGPAAGTLTPR